MTVVFSVVVAAGVVVTTVVSSVVTGVVPGVVGVSVVDTTDVVFNDVVEGALGRKGRYAIKCLQTSQIDAQVKNHTPMSGLPLDSSQKKMSS